MCEEMQEDHKELSVKSHVQLNVEWWTWGKILMAKEDVMDSVSTIITLEVNLRVKIDHSEKFSGAP